MKNMRGAITPEIQDIARSRLGREISVRELRLMPYVQYSMLNSGRLDTSRVNQEERDILKSWRDAGWFDGGASQISMTKDFWDTIHEILWLGYATC